ncbi:hypothetical protein [Actinoplanes sp. NPDC023714]|uniref:hypothetical protein n=1 Tax=Actinoplanes sp. NPDC023714 TaxID=3154322 RepID=UPI0033F7D64F
MRFNGEVTFGNLLTSATVIVAALTLFLSLRQARLQRRREIADAVRTAAADALAKLERYARLPGAVADRVQGLIIETTRMLGAKPQVDDLRKARDHLWSGLLREWQEARTAQRAEEVELAHVRLLGRRPDAYDGVADSVAALDEGALRCFEELLEAAQGAIRRYERDRARYWAEDLGNELRAELARYRQALESNADQCLATVRHRLRAVVAGEDAQVVDRTWHATDDPR